MWGAQLDEMTSEQRLEGGEGVHQDVRRVITKVLRAARECTVQGTSEKHCQLEKTKDFKVGGQRGGRLWMLWRFLWVWLVFLWEKVGLLKFSVGNSRFDNLKKSILPTVFTMKRRCITQFCIRRSEPTKFIGRNVYLAQSLGGSSWRLSGLMSLAPSEGEVWHLHDVCGGTPGKSRGWKQLGPTQS